MNRKITCMSCEHVREAITRAEDKVRNVLAFLSTVAVALVVANEFVRPQTMMPLLSISWTEFQSWLRLVIWLVFVAYVAAYAVVARNKFEYMRTHVLETIICVAWFPNYQPTLFHHFTNIFSVASLQVIGTLAHAWRVARWTIRRFSEHPLIVTGSAAMALISTCAVALNQIEPRTFPTIWEAYWYCLSTITTVGYNRVPETAMGRAVGAVLMLGGISLAGVFIGLISEYVRNRLVKRPANDAGDGLGVLIPGAEGVQEQAELQRQILAELKTNNQLLSELLAERRAAEGQDPDAPRTP